MAPTAAGEVQSARGALLRLHGTLPRVRATSASWCAFGAQATRGQRAPSWTARRRHELAVGLRGRHGRRARPEKRMTADGPRRSSGLLDVPEPTARGASSSPTGWSSLKGPTRAAQGPTLDQVVAAVWPARAEVRREYSARAWARRNALLAAHPLGQSVARRRSRTWDRELGAPGAGPTRGTRAAGGRPCSPSHSPTARGSWGVAGEADLGITGRARGGRRRGGVRGRAA